MSVSGRKEKGGREKDRDLLRKGIWTQTSRIDTTTSLKNGRHWRVTQKKTEPIGKGKEN